MIPDGKDEMVTPERAKNGERITLTKVYEIVSDLRHELEPRQRRLEYAVIALFVATASPKLSGPSATEVIAALLNLP